MNRGPEPEDVRATAVAAVAAFVADAGVAASAIFHKGGFVSGIRFLRWARAEIKLERNAAGL